MDVKNDLVAAFKARLPGVHLRTLEEGRATDALRFTIQVLNKDSNVRRTLVSWSCASGTVTLDTSGADEPLDVERNKGCAFDTMVDDFKAFNKSGESVVYALLDPWNELSQPTNQRYLRECLMHARETGKTVVLVGKDWKIPAELQSDLYLCDLPLPSLSELTEYIKSTVLLYTSNKELASKVTINQDCLPLLARACTGLTLNEAKSIVALSMVRYKGIGPDSIKTAVREKTRIVQRTGLLEYEEPSADMSTVGGLHNLKSYLNERGELFSPEARQAGIDPPRGVLIAGVPGTGKTLIARAIAVSWQQALIRFDIGKIFGSLVGESESNLRLALKTVEAVAPCVLFIDEIDKALNKNTSNDGGTSQRVFGAILSWMEDTKAEVYVVGAANDLDKLDAALIRRFDSTFSVDLPDERSRAEIFTINLKRVGVSLKQTELNALVKESNTFTGKEIYRAVQSALIKAFNLKQDVDVQLLLDAVAATVPIARTMKDQIDALRAYCKDGRAIPAAGSIEVDAIRNRKKGAEIDV